MKSRNKIRFAACAALVGFAAWANPIVEGWYADPQIRRYGDMYWVFSTTSARFANQTYFDAFSSKDMKTWTKHPRILTTNEVTWANGAMWHRTRTSLTADPQRRTRPPRCLHRSYGV